jgi:hypothetical protein
MHGRQAQLERVDRFLNRGVPGQPILAVLGLGGEGKSRLTWHWYERATPRLLAERGFAGKFWYDLYQRGWDLTRVIRAVLEKVTAKPEEVARLFDPEVNPGRERAEDQFVAALKQRRFLLVLDGLERQFTSWRAYQAGKLGPEDELHPTSRRMTTEDERLLKLLLGLRGSLVIITSRALPAIYDELAEPADDASPVAVEHSRA